MTYRELERAAAACARALAAKGVGPGNRVATTLSGVDFAVLLHALPRIGAVLVPLDERLTPKEHEELLAIARPSLVVKTLPDAPRSISTTHTVANLDLDEDAPFVAVFTSGTTGTPKAITLTYRNFAASADANAQNLGVEQDDRWLCVLPLFHVGGLSILTRSAIYATTAVVHDRFDVAAVKRALEEEDITLVSLVATQLRRLLDAGLERPPRLRAALVGGGPVPADLLERARSAGVPALPTYGMTETCSQIWTGKPLPGVEIRTSGEGELLVRGPMVAVGALAPDGWLHTGDRGTIGPDGTLHVEGRIGDTIVTGGENVAAAEVESALLSHPAVRDAAVVGRPDEEWGQAVVAYVVADGVSDDDLIAHCRARLAPYKLPKAIHRTGEIPRNAAGKILRGRLRPAG